MVSVLTSIDYIDGYLVLTVFLLGKTAKIGLGYKSEFILVYFFGVDLEQFVPSEEQRVCFPRKRVEVHDPHLVERTGNVQVDNHVVVVETWFDHFSEHFVYLLSECRHQLVQVVVVVQISLGHPTTMRFLMKTLNSNAGFMSTHWRNTNS